ncbi:ATP-dependent nuclease [Ursidibacter sp. B-7004-1]
MELSKNAIKDIENKIDECLSELTDFDGVLKDTRILINFAEFDKLRDIIKTMTSITLHDGNNHSIESKGSGAQRAVFLALMKYIAKNIKNSNIIWGIDEPEAFLQPKLQKRVFNSFVNMCSENSQQIIITTHSQHFINLNKMKSVNLFQGRSTLKEYKRKPGKKFHEINTENMVFKSNAEKILTIKEHLGIVNNDGWLLLPFNVIVEGEADKKYIEFSLQALNLPIPNILYTGGASKVGGVMQYYNEYAKDSNFENKPKVIGVYDNDSAGREESSKINPKKLKNLDIEIITIPRSDGKEKVEDNYDWEIEDFLPSDLLIDCANNLLKKERYVIISEKQKKSRYSSAYEKMNILKYLSECSRQNNIDKQVIDFNEIQWKRQLCQMFCDSISLEQFKKQLGTSQINFLHKLVDKNN